MEKKTVSIRQNIQIMQVHFGCSEMLLGFKPSESDVSY